jgi:hypothetical protein
MSKEVWDKIKEAVSMAKSSDCECDGAPAECVPCRRWSEVQAAMASGVHRKENEGWQITVESGDCSDSDKAAGILRARVRIQRKENDDDHGA